MNDAPAIEETAGSEYQVLARKYRPQSFEELIGQDALVRTLSNAIESDRVHHAFILTGVRGVGKTTAARIIAQSLNCLAQDGPTIRPCGVCENCQAIASSRHIDVLEMDAASRTGIGDIRELIDGVQYAPVSARYKVYIIDEVHMLSTAAFNGLLKTLEEPPEHVKFIFATTEIRKIPVTVLSRCQRFDLRRIGQEELVRLFADLLEREGVEAEAEVLNLIAAAAEGSARDGLSLLDQAIAHSGGTVATAQVRDMLGLADRSRVYDLFESLLKGEIKTALGQLREQYDLGADPLVLLQDLLEVTHWITRLKVVPDLLNDRAVSELELSRGGALAQKLAMPVLARTWQMLLKGLGEARQAPSSLAAVEMILVRLAYAAELPPPGDVVRELQEAAAEDATGKPAPAVEPPPAPATSSIAATRPIAAAALETAPTLAQAPAAATSAMPASLAEVAELAERHRDAMLYYELRENVHAVAFERGRIEIRPSADAPRGLAQQLSSRLAEWTGERWVVVINTEAEGAPTLAEQAAAALESELLEAREHPLVRAALESFPGAEITRMRSLAPDHGDREK